MHTAVPCVLLPSVEIFHVSFMLVEHKSLKTNKMVNSLNTQKECNTYKESEMLKSHSTSLYYEDPSLTDTELSVS
jgi:hypothetical protein